MYQVPARKFPRQGVLIAGREPSWDERTFLRHKEVRKVAFYSGVVYILANRFIDNW